MTADLPPYRISIQDSSIDISQETDSVNAFCPKGAMVLFTGHVRPDDGVVKIDIEHYPPMTDAAIAGIIKSAMQQWRLHHVTVVHRYGTVHVHQPIVFVATLADHRHAAFSACHYIMDYLKSRAPFWKKEWLKNTDNNLSCRWATAKDSDEQQLNRWDNG